MGSKRLLLSAIYFFLKPKANLCSSSSSIWRGSETINAAIERRELSPTSPHRFVMLCIPSQCEIIMIVLHPCIALFLHAPYQQRDPMPRESQPYSVTL
jgi:hypothetical protein